MRHAAHHLHLALLGQRRQAAGQFANHAFLPAANLVDVDAGLAEGHTVVADFFRLIDDLGHMQQRLGRNAADIQAHPAQGGVLFHQHHLLAQIGRAESRGITAGASAQYQHLCMQFVFTAHRLLLE